jgi:hypothetical protein
VRKNESRPSSEEPDHPAGSLRIVVSSLQFEWLTKQCEFLGITKQQLVAGVMDEWFCRNPVDILPVDPSATIQAALDQFMQQHRDEFLSVADEV